VISWIGARAWLPVLTILWGVIAAAQAAVKEEKALIALRFFLGAAEAGSGMSHDVLAALSYVVQCFEHQCYTDRWLP